MAAGGLPAIIYFVTALFPEDAMTPSCRRRRATAALALAAAVAVPLLAATAIPVAAPPPSARARRRHAVPQRRPVPRRPGVRGGGGARPAGHLLLRQHGRRRLEDDRCRHQLGADLGPRLHHWLGGRDRGRPLGPQRPLRRDRRVPDPRQRGGGGR